MKESKQMFTQKTSSSLSLWNQGGWLVCAGVALSPGVCLGLLGVAAIHIKAFKTREQCRQMSALGLQMLNHTTNYYPLCTVWPCGTFQRRSKWICLSWPSSHTACKLIVLGKEQHTLNIFIQTYVILDNIIFFYSGNKINKCLNVKIIREIISSRNYF